MHSYATYREIRDDWLCMTVIRRIPQFSCGLLMTETGNELMRVIEMIGATLLQEAQQPVNASAELPEDLLQQLQELLTKLEDYDSEAEDVLLGILEAVAGTTVNDLLQDIKKDVSQYDLEAAAEKLKPIIEQISNSESGHA